MKIKKLYAEYEDLGEKVKRNKEIARRFYNGESPTELGREYGVTRQRIYQLAKRYRKEEENES